VQKSALQRFLREQGQQAVKGAWAMHQTSGSRWRLRSLSSDMLTQRYTEEGLSLDEIAGVWR
jgi:hypothetical protein